MTDTVLPNPYFDRPFGNHWYDEQCKKYILQFMAVFADMEISIGKNDFNSETNLVKVPIRYGDADRVVNAILAENTTNKPIRVPMLSATLSEFQQAPQAQKGIGAIDRKSILPVGGSLPNDVEVLRRRIPTPYSLIFELNIITSNLDQKFQILEPILTIFDPLIQLQISDSPYDWNARMILQLDGISNEQNYPSQTDKRIIVTTLKFSTIRYFSVPFNFKKDFIKKVELKLNTLNYNETIESKTIEDFEYPQSTQGYETIIDANDLPGLPQK